MARSIHLSPMLTIKLCRMFLAAKHLFSEEAIVRITLSVSSTEQSKFFSKIISMINWWSFREFQLGLRMDNVTCLNDDPLPVHPSVFRRAEHAVFLICCLELRLRIFSWRSNPTHLQVRGCLLRWPRYVCKKTLSGFTVTFSIVLSLNKRP